MEVVQRFPGIKDPRYSGYVRHKSAHVLGIVMYAVLCRPDRLEEIVAYQGSKEKYLKKQFRVEELPSKSTVRRILHMVDRKAVREVILEIMRNRRGSAGRGREGELQYQQNRPGTLGTADTHSTFNRKWHDVGTGVDREKDE